PCPCIESHLTAINSLRPHLSTHFCFVCVKQNLPFSVQNKWRLLGMMVVFFGSGFAFPFVVVRHQLLKK
uniref:Cytochrome c oxidase subunit 7C, mitochondrial n=1 Tax=Oncorhynchus tshawytscha TaxID=74940 RepID=A0AAZ3PTP8_ONCTS